FPQLLQASSAKVFRDVKRVFALRTHERPSTRVLVLILSGKRSWRRSASRSLLEMLRSFNKRCRRATLSLFGSTSDKIAAGGDPQAVPVRTGGSRPNRRAVATHHRCQEQS